MLTRKVLLAAALSLFTTQAGAAQTPSPNYFDKSLLAADQIFQNRVKESILATCVSIANEAVTPSSIQWHIKRANMCAVIFTSTSGPDGFKVLFSSMAATDTNVINDATQNGSVPLTAGNVSTQAVLVTDPHIDTAVQSQFNSLLSLP